MQLKKAIFLSNLGTFTRKHLSESKSRDPPSFRHSLLNGLFLQNRSDPILVTCLKTVVLQETSSEVPRMFLLRELTIFSSFPNRAVASSPGKPHHLGAEPAGGCVRKLVKEPRWREATYHSREAKSFLGLFEGQTVHSPRWNTCESCC